MLTRRITSLRTCHSGSSHDSHVFRSSQLLYCTGSACKEDYARGNICSVSIIYTVYDSISIEIYSTRNERIRSHDILNAFFWKLCKMESKSLKFVNIFYKLFFLLLQVTLFSSLYLHLFLTSMLLLVTLKPNTLWLIAIIFLTFKLSAKLVLP